MKCVNSDGAAYRAIMVDDIELESEFEEKNRRGH